jgi:hypothetical protein
MNNCHSVSHFWQSPSHDTIESFLYFDSQQYRYRFDSYGIPSPSSSNDGDGGIKSKPPLYSFFFWYDAVIIHPFDNRPFSIKLMMISVHHFVCWYAQNVRFDVNWSIPKCNKYVLNEPAASLPTPFQLPSLPRTLYIGNVTLDDGQQVQQFRTIYTFFQFDYFTHITTGYAAPMLCGYAMLCLSHLFLSCHSAPYRMIIGGDQHDFRNLTVGPIDPSLLIPSIPCAPPSPLESTSWRSDAKLPLF